MNRRAVLTASGVTISGLLAGCTEFDDGEDDGGGGSGEEIVRFFVTNEDDVARSIEIEIQAEGEAVASGVGTLPPADEQDLPFRYGFPSIGVPVTAAVQSDNAGRSVQWDPSNCAELRVDARIVEGEPNIEEICQ